MTETLPYRLYGRRGAGSMAAQMLLEELGLPYEVVWLEDETIDRATYAKLCPTGKIPALVLPCGTLIFESAAIVIHLSSLSGGSLAPQAGTVEHAKFLQWIIFISANLYDTALRIYFPQRYTSAGEADAPRVKAKAIADFNAQLALLNGVVSPYLLGSTVSAADLYLTMLAGWHPEGPDAVRAVAPKVAALTDAVLARPAVARVVALNG